MVKRLALLGLLAITFTLVLFTDTEANARITPPSITNDCAVEVISPNVKLLKCIEDGYTGFSIIRSKTYVEVYWQSISDNKAKFKCKYLTLKNNRVKVGCTPSW